MVISNLLDSVATQRPFMKIFVNYLSTFYRQGISSTNCHPHPSSTGSQKK